MCRVRRRAGPYWVVAMQPLPCIFVKVVSSACDCDLGDTVGNFKCCAKAPLQIYEVLVVIYIVMEAQLALVFIIGLCLCVERSDTSASATAAASVQWEGNEEF